jgi:hypothetical protein
MRWAGHVALFEEKRNAYSLLVENPEGKRQLGRLRRMWEDNIKMDLEEIGWGGMECINLPQDRDKMRALVNTLMNFRLSQNA